VTRGADCSAGDVDHGVIVTNEASEVMAGVE
jgi:hypothetical protein